MHPLFAYWPDCIAGAGVQVATAAGDMLSVIDMGAAHLNDKINLFKSEAKFPDVFRSALPLDFLHILTQLWNECPACMTATLLATQ